MLPNIDIRLANCIKALEEIVIPSLGESERMAREQALLVIGHLRMIGAQWKHAARFEAKSFEAMAALAGEIAANEPDFRGELADALDATGTVDRGDIDAVEAAICRVGKAIDKAILGDEGTMALSAASVAAILDYGQKQAVRERVWFKGSGLDPDAAILPDFEPGM